MLPLISSCASRTKSTIVASDLQILKTGDSRSNENLHLTTLHLIMLRQHNRIAGELAKVSPHWDDERLYQETKRIVTAQLQHVTYQELLEPLLGQEIMDRYNLTLLDEGFLTAYDENLDPTVANSFATAAFRFAHSLLPGLMRSYETTSPGSWMLLRKVLFNPFPLYSSGSLDRILQSAIKTDVQKTNRFFTTEVTQHLFEEPQNETSPKKCGLDLVSLNIQRGRDHGLPGYVKWLEHCGLPRPEQFKDLSGLIDEESLKAMKLLYDTLDYIRKMTASVYDAGSVVRVELELPFVYDTKYTIMEFRPIISRSNVSEDLALILNISRDLYIMDFEDKNYFNLRQADLNSVCNIYSPAVYTCSNLEPTLKPIAGECFLNQLFGSRETESKPDFGSCPILALRLSKPIFYKMADGSLLYQAPKQVLSKVQCREPVSKTISILLFDKGIITINSPQCSINASGFIFAPSTINSDAEMFPLRDIIGQGFKIDFPCWVTDRLLAVPSRHTGLVRDASELTDFAGALHDLERSQENDGYNRYINFAYQSSWTPITMMGLLIVILIAMGAVVAFRRKKPTAKLDLPPPLV
ncbi:unnamed protein product [Nesidiocoris tenuis]|uniref:Uncharacterized protein n=1 Tax=Nesidiocoris tenuis TaxID=355587 RepID=A0A6H5HFQ1_9HEMI|nr:unnamed protein product [Nesidiocoris tenuis]